MKKTSNGCALLFFVLVLSVHSAGQDVIPHRQDRLPNCPLSPEEAVEAMTVALPSNWSPASPTSSTRSP
jgi:hypothetical protein